MKKLKNSQIRAMAAVAILAIILMSAGLAAAQGRGGGMRQGMGHGQGMGICGSGSDDGFGPGHRIEMMTKHLGLSEKQQAAITGIFEDGRKTGLESRKKLMRLRNELQGEMLKDNPSEKTILGLNEEMGKLKTEMRAVRLKTRLAVREELTLEQRDQMLMMGGPGNKGGHHGSRGKGGPGSGARHGCGNGPGMGQRFSPDCPNNE